MGWGLRLRAGGPRGRSGNCLQPNTSVSTRRSAPPTGCWPCLWEEQEEEEGAWALAVV